MIPVGTIDPFNPFMGINSSGLLLHTFISVSAILGVGVTVKEVISEVSEHP